MPPKEKFEPVHYISNAAKRTISVPDESTVEKIRGKDTLRQMPQSPISFTDGTYIARSEREVEIIESQPDFGKKLGGWTTITRVPSEEELKEMKVKATKDQIKKAQEDLAKMEAEAAAKAEPPAAPAPKPAVKKTAAKKVATKKG